MKIELKKVRHAKFASHESPCFTAEVWIAGKKAGTAENDGHGGMTFIHPHELRQRLQEHAATLPPAKMTSGGGESWEFRQSAESLVDDAFAEWELGKQFDALISSRVLVLEANGRISQTKRIRRDELRRILGVPETLARVAKGRPVLNAMPREEAFAAFRAGVGA